MDGQLQPEVEQFIDTYIDSLEQLEVLLLLSKSPDRAWAVGAVYDEIKSNPSSISKRLETLTQQGLVIRNDADATYRFHAPNPELARTVTLLAAAYAERRIRVIETIFSKPSPSIRSFADAFRIRKENRDG